MNCTHDLANWAASRIGSKSLWMALGQLDVAVVDHLLKRVDAGVIVLVVQHERVQWRARFDVDIVVAWRG